MTTSSSRNRRPRRRQYVVVATRNDDWRQMAAFPMAQDAETALQKAQTAARRRFGRKWAKTATYRHNP
ncbi:MAG TPA: hypothetical protein VK028_12080 [Micromonosporaceae bacterium]|nr:hypothetical protein [Micromonosporaceae bacterium]